MAMDYLHGEDLRSIAKALGTGAGMPIEHAVNVIRAVCAGLHYAHTKTGASGEPLHIVHVCGNRFVHGGRRVLIEQLLEPPGAVSFAFPPHHRFGDASPPGFHRLPNIHRHVAQELAELIG